MLFPILNNDTKISDEKGLPTDEFLSYLASLHLKLQQFLGDEGLKTPQLNKEISDATVQQNTLPRIIYNSDTKKYAVLLEKADNTHYFQSLATVNSLTTAESEATIETDTEPRLIYNKDLEKYQLLVYNTTTTHYEFKTITTE